MKGLEWQIFYQLFIQSGKETPASDGQDFGQV